MRFTRKDFVIAAAAVAAAGAVSMGYAMRGGAKDGDDAEARALFSGLYRAADVPGDALAKLGVPAAWAEDPPEGATECQADKFTGDVCATAFSGHVHGALAHFHGMVCHLNNGFTQAPEQALCHFVNSMGMDPDLAALPQTVTKAFGTMTVVLTVEAPTEAFATTAGYTAKATVTVNGTTFMVLYWAGSGTASKGFMVQGGCFGSACPGGATHGFYIQWDRTTADQTVNVLAAFLLSGSFMGGANDHAMWGKLAFDSATNEVIVRLINMEDRGAPGSAGCYRVMAKGTKGGQVCIAKTSASEGDALTNASTDKTGMDGARVTDSATTPDGTGNYATGDMATFESDCGWTIDTVQSCNTVKNNGTALFASSTVDFTAEPADAGF